MLKRNSYQIGDKSKDLTADNEYHQNISKLDSTVTDSFDIISCIPCRKPYRDEIHELEILMLIPNVEVRNPHIPVYQHREELMENFRGDVI